MTFGNCFLWAFPRWLRHYFRGDALVIRKSRWNVSPHMMIAPCIEGLQVREYNPLKPVRSFRWFPIHALIFRGRVNTGPATCICPSCRDSRRQAQSRLS